MSNSNRIDFSVIQDLVRQGYMCFDLHVHTRTSKDAFLDVHKALQIAKEQCFGFAIMDHNEIEAALYAHEHRDGVPVILGIEVKARNGVDIGVLFYDRDDLIDFYDRYIVPAKELDAFVPDLSIEEILEAAQKYRTVIIGVHPYAPRYCGIAGVVDRRVVSPTVYDALDIIEVVNGSMTHHANARARCLAKELGKPISAGSDAHWIRHFGSALTCIKVHEDEHPLDALLRQEPYIVHSPTPRLHTAFVFGLGQLRLLTFPRGLKMFTNHLSICASLKTRTVSPPMDSGEPLPAS